MVGKLLLRGLLAGLIAGVITFGFAYIFGEPSVDGAIAFEDQMATDESAPADEASPTITRDTQKSIGLLTGIVFLGVALGGIYSVLFAFANGRIGRLNTSQTAVLLAALCFVTLVLTPWLKYPASPPASTLDDTIGFRTSLYFLMLGFSIVVSVGAWMVRMQLVPRLGQWNATLVTIVGYVVAVMLLNLMLPSVNEVPDGFPAQVLWDFRMASLGTQAVLWGSLALVFSGLVDRTIPQLAMRRVAPAH